MRLLNKLTILAIISSILAGLASNLIIKWTEGYGLAVLLIGCVATVSVNAAYEEWDKRRPRKVAKVEAKAEEKPPALDIEKASRNDPKGFCDYCGTYNSPNYKYCGKCGVWLGREPKLPEVPELSRAVEPDKQMIVTKDQFSVYMGEKFNEIQGFIDTRLVRMEVVLQVASEQVKSKMMTASEFVTWAKEKQAEVEAVDGETDKWLSKLSELKALIIQRLDYAKSRQGQMAIKSAESIPDPDKMREYIAVQRQHFGLQERIARRLMDWHNNMEKVLTDTKDHIDEMFWQAILASIPADVKAVGEKAELQAPKAQENA